MYEFSILQPTTGEIVRSGRCSALSDVAIQSGTGEVVLDGILDGAAVYLPDGITVTDRPASLPADTPAVAVGASWVVELPPGTVVAGRNGSTAVDDDGSFSTGPLDAGGYRFDLYPPFPWRQQTIWVTAS